MKNPQAFPRPYSNDFLEGDRTMGDRIEEWHEQDGMTLRDYFAAKSLQGFCSSREQYSCLIMASKNSNLRHEEYIAKEMYLMADAMLKERLK